MYVNPKYLIYPSPAPFPLQWPSVCFLNLWVCFCFVNKFICIILNIPHISDIIWYLSFSVWLTLLSKISSRSIRVVVNGIISFFFFFILFNGWAVFHCIYVPYLLYPFLCLWTFRLLPCLGYYKHHCTEHWGACIFSDYAFLSVYAQQWDYWIICLSASLEANRHWDLQLLGANEALDSVEAPVERIGMGLSSPWAVEMLVDQHARTMVWGGGHSPSWEKLVIRAKGRLQWLLAGHWKSVCFQILELGTESFSPAFTRRTDSTLCSLKSRTQPQRGDNNNKITTIPGA